MKKIIIILTGLLISSISFTFFFHSCEKEDVTFSENSQQLLSIKGSLSDANSLTTEDYTIISKAITRMGVTSANGKFETNGISAEKLGIAKDLYDQLIFAFKKANGDLSHKRIRKKANGEEAYSNKVDCVPALISEVLGFFGNSSKLNDIKSWCKSKGYYVEKKGIYPAAIDTIMHHYFKAEYCGLDKLKVGYSIKDPEISNNGCYIITVKISDTEGHILRVRSISNAVSGIPIYWCSNPQDGPGTTPYLGNNIMSTYYVSGITDF